jgi:hypothetical protein
LFLQFIPLAAIFDDRQVALDERLTDLQSTRLRLVRNDDAAVFVGNAEVQRDGGNRSKLAKHGQGQEALVEAQEFFPFLLKPSLLTLPGRRFVLSKFFHAWAAQPRQTPNAIQVTDDQ